MAVKRENILISISKLKINDFFNFSEKMMREQIIVLVKKINLKNKGLN